MIILVDQDGVLADFDAGWWRNLQRRHPNCPDRNVRSRPMFKVADLYRDEPLWVVAGRMVVEAPGFFAGLPPVPGAIDGIRALADAGHDVYICTSPLTAWKNCVAEKHEWVEQHLGPDWVSRVILTKDKTLVTGDILIDDKPHVTGLRTPDWVHVRYDRSYNANLPGPRLTWDNAAEVIGGLQLAA